MAIAKILKEYRQTWGSLPATLLDRSSLSPMARLLYGVLDSFAYGGQLPTQERICVRMGLQPTNRKTLRRYLRELVDAGFLEVVSGRKTWEANTYTLKLPEYCYLESAKLLEIALQMPVRANEQGWEAGRGREARKPRNAVYDRLAWQIAKAAKAEKLRLASEAAQTKLHFPSLVAQAPEKAKTVVPGGPTDVVPGGPTDVVPGGPTDVVPGGPTDVVPGGPTDVVPGGPTDVVPGGPTDVVPGGPTDVVPGGPTINKGGDINKKGEKGERSAPPPSVSQPENPPVGWEAWPGMFEAAREGKHWLWDPQEREAADKIVETLKNLLPAGTFNFLWLKAVQVNYLNCKPYWRERGNTLRGLNQQLRDYLPTLPQVQDLCEHPDLVESEKVDRENNEIITTKTKKCSICNFSSSTREKSRDESAPEENFEIHPKIKEAVERGRKAAEKNA